VSSDDTVPADRSEPAVALRRTLQAVAAATPTPDRSAELLAALDERTAVAPAERPGADPAAADHSDGPLSPVATEDSRRRPGAGRWLLVAAGVLVVVASAVAVSRRGSEGETGVVNQPAEVPATGWFLPGREWKITSVQTDFLDVGELGACPCTLWAAGRTGTEPAVIDVIESAPGDGPSGDNREQVDVGGRPGEVGGIEWIGVEGMEALQVVSEGRQLTIFVRAVDRAQALVLADAWLDRTDAGDRVDVDALPLPDGFQRTADVAKSGTLEHVLIIRAEEATTGDEVEYQLVPTGYNRLALLSADTLQIDRGVFETTGVEPGTGPYVARVGGPVDILAGQSFFGESIEPLPRPALKRFVDSLHEVSTQDWREALAGAEGEVDPDVLVAPSLFDPPLTDR